MVSGPSGSGKTTLARRVLESRALKGKLFRSVSFTTRLRRSGERNKKDYVFLSPAEFLKMRRAGKFLEWTRYLGQYYATSREFLDRQLARHRHIILCLDARGARSIRGQYPRESVTIFVLPPSRRELSGRIKNRCHKTRDEEVSRRLELAKDEMRLAGNYDYRLVNKKLPLAISRLRQIILKEIKGRGLL